MNRLYLIIYSIVLVIFSNGCFFYSVQNEYKYTIQDLSAIQDTMIVLEKTACYGFCPEYRITLFGNGDIIYEGKNNVKTKGVIKNHINPTKVIELIDVFNNYNFLSFKDNYNQDCELYATDNQTIIIYLKLNSISKKVAYYAGCTGFNDEEELIMIENSIKNITNSKSLVGEQINYDF